MSGAECHPYRSHGLRKELHRQCSGSQCLPVRTQNQIWQCCKSFLLFNLFRDYLHSVEATDENIIGIALDEVMDARYRNPMELDTYIRSRITDSSKRYCVFIDEIQMVASIQNPYLDDKSSKIGFADVLLGLMKTPNADIYVTGSNSRMLSSDIMTEFRGRGDEIWGNPLTYGEFYSAFEGDKRNAWREYYTYGGMPLILSHSKDARR